MAGELWAFCDDLGTPELCIILDSHWFEQHRERIRSLPGVVAADSRMILFESPKWRCFFELKFSDVDKQI